MFPVSAFACGIAQHAASAAVLCGTKIAQHVSVWSVPMAGPLSAIRVLVVWHIGVISGASQLRLYGLIARGLGSGDRMHCPDVC